MAFSRRERKSDMDICCLGSLAARATDPAGKSRGYTVSPYGTSMVEIARYVCIMTFQYLLWHDAFSKRVYCLAKDCITDMICMNYFIGRVYDTGTDN